MAISCSDLPLVRKYMANLELRGFSSFLIIIYYINH